MGKPCGWRAQEKLRIKSFCKNSAGLQKILLQCALAVRLFNITSNYRANPSKRESCYLLSSVVYGDIM